MTPSRNTKYHLIHKSDWYCGVFYCTFTKLHKHLSVLVNIKPECLTKTRLIRKEWQDWEVHFLRLCLPYKGWMNHFLMPVIFKRACCKHKGIKIKPSTGYITALSFGPFECHYSVISCTLLLCFIKDVMFCLGIY